MDMDLSEKRFEEDIEDYFVNHSGFRQLSVIDESNRRVNITPYDNRVSLYPFVFIEFIEKTQPKVMEKYNRLYGEKAGEHLINELIRNIDNLGLIYVLKNGFKDMGTDIKVCYFKPESELNETANELYKQNIFGVARQFHYSPELERSNTIDMVLSLNGIPIIALELKNQNMGQDVEDAISQYRTDRNPKEPCFKLNRRFLAYFAVDLDEVWVSTKLDGENTQFIPFNQGSAGAGNPGGKGNPDKPNAYKTSYLWEKILTKDSILKLIGKYITLVKTKREEIDNHTTKIITKEEILFPRYHQLDVVDKIVDDVKHTGAGKNYLVEHSAGSGKSNSIAWLTYQLASLHDLANNYIFDSVIVITNRIVLDNQLQETIASFDHRPGQVETIDSKKGASGLKDAINDKKKIIICTIQKFLYAYKDFADFSGRKFAIIIDEAHQGQSGESARTLRKSLIDSGLAIMEYAEEEGVDAEDIDPEGTVLEELIAQGHHENQSFFAFTATPKNKTLEFFGTYDPETDKYKPFHVYSMRQAIEEGFILDVLQNYTTIKQAFNLVKTTSENPELVESDATKALIQYYKYNDVTIQHKVEVIMTNFLNNGRYKIGGKGKAMVVTDSRKGAVLYYFAIKDYIKNHPQECRGTDALVAFSGEVTLEGKSYTEATLNIDDSGNYINTDKKFRAAIKSPRYNIMVVADKYQMGFDEDLLHSMYIDKTLKDVAAVQTISRLNRSCQGKDDTFVLDFINTEEDIKKAFQPYYEETDLQGTTYFNKVYDFKQQIAEYNVYSEYDVDNYFDYMSKHKDDKSPNVIGGLRNCLSDPIRRYNDIEEEKERFDFRMLLRNFTKSYSYITSLVRLHDEELYKEFVFASSLIKFLPIDKRGKVNIDDKVALQYVSLKTTFEGSIVLEKQNVDLNPSVTKKSTRIIKKDTLGSIIDRLNDLFGEEFKDGDKLIVNGIFAKFMNSSEYKRLQRAAKNNDKNMFKNEYFKEKFDDFASDCYEENEDTYKKLTNDSDFYEKVLDVMGEVIYRKLKNEDDDTDKNKTINNKSI